ncbi:MAG: hypothetical protein D6785_16415, partial [Planctomycetota bacterium]
MGRRRLSFFRFRLQILSFLFCLNLGGFFFIPWHPLIGKESSPSPLVQLLLKWEEGKSQDQRDIIQKLYEAPEVWGKRLRGFLKKRPTPWKHLLPLACQFVNILMDEPSAPILLTIFEEERKKEFSYKKKFNLPLLLSCTHTLGNLYYLPAGKAFLKALEKTKNKTLQITILLNLPKVLPFKDRKKLIPQIIQLFKNFPPHTLFQKELALLLYQWNVSEKWLLQNLEKKWAILILGNYPSQESTKALLSLAKQEQGKLLSMILVELGRKKAWEGLPLLGKSLMSWDQQVELGALKGLSLFPSPKILPYLYQYARFKGEDRQEDILTIIAPLVSKKDSQWIPLLQQWMENPLLMPSILKILEKIESPQIPSLVIPLLYSNNLEIASYAAYLLGKYQKKLALEKLKFYAGQKGLPLSLIAKIQLYRERLGDEKGREWFQKSFEKLPENQFSFLVPWIVRLSKPLKIDFLKKVWKKSPPKRPYILGLLQSYISRTPPKEILFFLKQGLLSSSLWMNLKSLEYYMQLKLFPRDELKKKLPALICYSKSFPVLQKLFQEFPKESFELYPLFITPSKDSSSSTGFKKEKFLLSSHAEGFL